MDEQVALPRFIQRALEAFDELVGSLRMNPTVSLSRNGRLWTTTFRTVVSRVAKSLSSAKTSDFESRFIRVDLPALV